MYGKTITALHIKALSESVDEEDTNLLAETIRVVIAPKTLNPVDWMYIPTNQMKGDFLVTSFEPRSMLGIAQRQGFEYLLKEGEFYSILWVE